MSDNKVQAILVLLLVMLFFGALFLASTMKQPRPLKYHDLQAFCPHCGQPISNGP